MCKMSHPWLPPFSKLSTSHTLNNFLYLISSLQPHCQWPSPGWGNLNSFLLGVPAFSLALLKSILNPIARAIVWNPKPDQVTWLFESLQYLPIAVTAHHPPFPLNGVPTKTLPELPSGLWVFAQIEDSPHLLHSMPLGYLTPFYPSSLGLETTQGDHFSHALPPIWDLFPFIDIPITQYTSVCPVFLIVYQVI